VSGGVPATFLPSPETLRAASRLERHVEWHKGFWLAYVFTVSPPQAHILQERVGAKLRAQGRSQRVLRPETFPALERVLTDEILINSHETGCTWVEVMKDADAWTKAWGNFVLRANERRELLRENLEGGLILVVHPDLKSETRNAGPDLWSIRSFVFELPPSTSERSGDFATTRMSGDEIRRSSMFSDPKLLEDDLRRLPDALREQEDAARARIKQKIASRLQAAGRNVEAVGTWGEVVEIYRSLAQEQPDDFLADLAIALKGLGDGLVENQRYSEAEEAYRDAIFIQQRLYKTHEHGDIAASLTKLARALTHQGRYAEAEKAYTDAISILHKTKGHAAIAASLTDLADVLTRQGRHDEAEQFHKEAEIAATSSSLTNNAVATEQYLKGSASFEDPDLELLDRWQQGDRDAGQQLVRRYFRNVRLYFLRTFPSEEVQDLIQETFTRILRLKDSHVMSSFRTYLLNVARHVGLEHLRRRYRETPLNIGIHADSLEDPDSRSQDSVLADREEHRRLLNALRHLPPEQQEIIELYYWQRLTGREIGEILALPESTVRGRLRAALQRLRTSYRGLDQQEAHRDFMEGEIEAWLEDLRDRLGGFAK
jgi:RNA polymerase sigma-70 factor, ECF subfamily